MNLFYNAYVGGMKCYEIKARNETLSKQTRTLYKDSNL